jgi:acetyltransferase-like isoleucine patch superfamily enzyme
VIGKNVGMSAAALVAHNEIVIGDDVKIGGGTCIYDTDFHSLDAVKRTNSFLDRCDESTAPVLIDNRVFIGAHTTILKGVHIGENSVVGACSVVTKSIPANEVWAGNPAKFIKTADSL